MKRKTNETIIEILDSEKIEIVSQDKIFNHMLKTLFFYMKMPVKITADFDLRHHLWEDTGIIIGQFIKEKIKSKTIKRFSSSILPMDDALVITSVDISRSYANVDLLIKNQENGFEEGLFKEFIYALSKNIPATIHFKQLNGENAHHIIECCFKSLGFNLKSAILENDYLNSTKGMI